MLLFALPLYAIALVYGAAALLPAIYPVSYTHLFFKSGLIFFKSGV